MILTIDHDSPVPPYVQIREQVETMAVTGVLPEGFRLPSIRQLALDLGLAPATVARAYSTLESAGIVQSRRGRGTSVAGGTQRLGRRETNLELAKAAEAFAQRVHQLGIEGATAVAAVGKALTSLGDR